MARPVAVITGAARGIGRETARQLSATHRVAVLDIDAEGAERAAADIGGDAVWAACDITDQDVWDSFVITHLYRPQKLRVLATTDHRTWSLVHFLSGNLRGWILSGAICG